jgi:hypothetical protein
VREFDLGKLRKAYEIEFKECARGVPQKGHLLAVPITCLFYRYRQVCRESDDDETVIPLDFFDFYRWLLQEAKENDRFSFRAGFWNLYHFDYHEELGVHALNVTCGNENPSAEGFWKMMKELHKLNRRRRDPIGNLRLIIWKKGVN